MHYFHHKFSLIRAGSPYSLENDFYRFRQLFDRRVTSDVTCNHLKAEFSLVLGLEVVERGATRSLGGGQR